MKLLCIAPEACPDRRLLQQLERRHEVRLLGPGAKEIEDAAGNRPDTTKQQSWERQMRVILGAEHPDLLILFAGKSLFELVAWMVQPRGRQKPLAAFPPSVEATRGSLTNDNSAERGKP
jgi:hypothetical protein